MNRNKDAVIDLLSSDDDDNSIGNKNSAAQHGIASEDDDFKIPSVSKTFGGDAAIAKNTDRNERFNDEDEDDDDVILIANNNDASIDPSTSIAVVRAIENPYKKKRPHDSDNSAINSLRDTKKTAGKKENAGAARTAIENPHKKKWERLDAKKSGNEPKIDQSATSRKDAPEKAPAKPKQKKQNRKEQLLKNPPIERELQAGLVFEEDVDHITHHIMNRPKTSLKQSSITMKSSVEHAKKSSMEDEYHTDVVNDMDSDNQTINIPPTSAQAYAQHQFKSRIVHNLPPILYHDPDFVAGNPATIDGVHIVNKNAKKKDPESKNNDEINTLSTTPPKCRCRPPKPCTLMYSSKQGPNFGRPYHCCQQKSRGGGCNYFSWAFTSHMLHWYRFGPHNGHALVKPNRGFRAEDLVQGKVGDCWFLSALAVVAEREDLIGRLIGDNNAIQDASQWMTAKDTKSQSTKSTDNCGVVGVTLFVDGYWKTIIMDDFLPCIISQEKEKKEEYEVRLAVEQSMVDAGMSNTVDNSYATLNKRGNFNSKNQKRRVSSKFDPNSIADECRTILGEIQEFLHHDRWRKDPLYRTKSNLSSSDVQPLNRLVTTSDLAYSKAKNNQLWVPFIEKAYAKMHGSYQAISGGHVAEAFLDLTGAPTAVYNFDHHDFRPREFWYELMEFQQKRLPMGCGTSSSQEGIVGMHAYSILDVKEIKNVGLEFFREKLVQGTHGNVSGFTEFDGTVRLLRIRNPHGQGEWKGEFSDKSPIWESLMKHKNASWSETSGFPTMGSRGAAPLCDLTAPQSPDLQRTMVNDGTFWISYDDFLLGFSNVDVVLAFQGNHAKSFATNFPLKKSNHRCARSFELSVVGRQPGEKEPINDKVEVYIMGIQKTRRGAYHGRADRKRSYKASDLGILVGECCHSHENEDMELNTVDGRFFGLNRNGHIRLVLDRRDQNSKMIVMPVSFSHPAATDEEFSFVLRFVADAPLLVQELQKTPKLNGAIQKLCFGNRVMSLGIAGTSRHRGTQCNRSVLLESPLFRIERVDFLAGGGGTVFVYLCVNSSYSSQLPIFQHSSAISFSIEVNCRGMVCRTADGLVNHEVISKGKKFEAAWRRFSVDYKSESKSRLLMAVVQSGQDYQMGSINCRLLHSNHGVPSENRPMSKYTVSPPENQNDGFSNDKNLREYDEFGLFASVDMPFESFPNKFQQAVNFGDMVDFTRHKDTAVDLSLQIALKKSREEYDRKNAVATNTIAQRTLVDICDSPEQQCVDDGVDAAIMASILEQKGGHNALTERSFSEELEQAIKLSLTNK